MSAMAGISQFKDRTLIASIGDEVSLTSSPSYREKEREKLILNDKFRIRLQDYY